MNSRRLPLPEEIDAIGAPLMSDGGAVAPQDINKVVRLNLEFLEIQQLIHLTERKFASIHGEDWMDKFKLSSLSEIAKKYPSHRFELAQAIQEINEDPNFQFAGENIEFPRLSTKKISQLTGITSSRLEDIRKEERLQGGVKKHGKPFLVEELIALANALNTTVVYLLTPPLGFINKGVTVLNFKEVTHSTSEAIPFSRWVLWLHNLKSLPSQNQVMFERVLSSTSWSKVFDKTELKQPNSKASKVTTRAAIKRERYGVYSCFQELENYAPLLEEDIVDVTVDKVPNKSGAFEDEVEITMTNMEVFVELRKLFREHNLIRSLPDRKDLVEISSRKITNGFTKIFMSLRAATLLRVLKTKTKI